MRALRLIRPFIMQPALATMPRIVYNRFKDGLVSICSPTPWALGMMSCGGFWNKERGFADRQIASMVNRGIREDVAARYAKAMMFGGCTTAEALEIIRDRDCSPHGYAIELWDVDDIPKDRWFRNAWKRSHNGGPIGIDLNLAKPVQWQRVNAIIQKENKRRFNSFEGLHSIEFDRDRLREKIKNARDEIELRHIWPEEAKGLFQ